ncbi:unnamed protein product [Bursaphelenchus xylophilus]|uniref:(pine wood nematode) hypothetical protein n=1 Tax=Bursaphelenchus xylophilus TaxID=6326 RepID=A0A1I7S8E0_BURXY|nr:unnamed protein product [Bursaphelenchus xylophilus]CAG9121001.1 unnamed protein product [Bursaphelenchus xylophilus]
MLPRLLLLLPSIAVLCQQNSRIQPSGYEENQKWPVQQQSVRHDLDSTAMDQFYGGITTANKVVRPTIPATMAKSQPTKPKYDFPEFHPTLDELTSILPEPSTTPFPQTVYRTTTTTSRPTTTPRVIFNQQSTIPSRSRNRQPFAENRDKPERLYQNVGQNFELNFDRSPVNFQKDERRPRPSPNGPRNDQRARVSQRKPEIEESNDVYAMVTKQSLDYLRKNMPQTANRGSGRPTVPTNRQFTSPEGSNQQFWAQNRQGFRDQQNLPTFAGIQSNLGYRSGEMPEGYRTGPEFTASPEKPYGNNRSPYSAERPDIRPSPAIDQQGYEANSNANYNAPGHYGHVAFNSSRDRALQYASDQAEPPIYEPQRDTRLPASASPYDQIPRRDTRILPGRTQFQPTRDDYTAPLSRNPHQNPFNTDENRDITDLRTHEGVAPIQPINSQRDPQFAPNDGRYGYNIESGNQFGSQLPGYAGNNFNRDNGQNRQQILRNGPNEETGYVTARPPFTSSNNDEYGNSESSRRPQFNSDAAINSYGSPSNRNTVGFGAQEDQERTTTEATISTGETPEITAESATQGSNRPFEGSRVTVEGNRDTTNQRTWSNRPNSQTRPNLMQVERSGYNLPGGQGRNLNQDPRYTQFNADSAPGSLHPSTRKPSGFAGIIIGPTQGAGPYEIENSGYQSNQKASHVYEQYTRPNLQQNKDGGYDGATVSGQNRPTNRPTDSSGYGRQYSRENSNPYAGSRSNYSPRPTQYKSDPYSTTSNYNEVSSTPRRDQTTRAGYEPSTSSTLDESIFSTTANPYETQYTTTNNPYDASNTSPRSHGLNVNQLRNTKPVSSGYDWEDYVNQYKTRTQVSNTGYYHRPQTTTGSTRRPTTNPYGHMERTTVATPYESVHTTASNRDPFPIPRALFVVDNGYEGTSKSPVSQSLDSEIRRLRDKLNKIEAFTKYTLDNKDSRTTSIPRVSNGYDELLFSNDTDEQLLNGTLTTIMSDFVTNDTDANDTTKGPSNSQKTEVILPHSVTVIEPSHTHPTTTTAAAETTSLTFLGTTESAETTELPATTTEANTLISLAKEQEIGKDEVLDDTTAKLLKALHEDLLVKKGDKEGNVSRSQDGKDLVTVEKTVMLLTLPESNETISGDVMVVEKNSTASTTETVFPPVDDSTTMASTTISTVDDATATGNATVSEIDDATNTTTLAPIVFPAPKQGEGKPSMTI